MPFMAEPQSTEHLLCHLLTAIWDAEHPNLLHAIPWPDVVQLAQTQGVASVLHAALHQTDVPVPEETQQALERAYYQVAADNTLNSKDLRPIVESLSAAGVPVLLVKGVALAETLYRDLAPRPASDFDLVVPPEGLPVCQEILAGLGYVPIEIELAPGADLAYRSGQVFASGEPSRVPVGLHWHLLDLPHYLCRVPMAWFWENTVKAEITGQPVRILNAEANLLYLSAHLALHHRLHGLRWFLDLALLVHQHQGTLDWDKVITAAQAFELLLAVQATLDRLAGCWPSLPLDGPRARLHQLNPTRFERRLFRLLTTEPRTPFLDFYTDILSLPDRQARIRFVLLNVFPQPAYMAQRYGAQQTRQLPYWYLYRLGEGAVKLARTVPQILQLRSA
jgi:hypothetical protein